MKKIFLMSFVALMALPILSGCTAPGQAFMEEPGVSKALSDARKAVVSDVRYDLRFRIPARKSVPVEGEETIRFNLSTKGPVILDFRDSDSSHVKEVMMNGKPIRYVLRNEHILIPKSRTAKGENQVRIRFVSADQSLNRNDEYLYTLLVPERARTVFPCFDQPDLKAGFSLTLDIPSGWTAVSNTDGQMSDSAGRRMVRFARTKPISTYLFSFVAGKWKVAEYVRGSRRVRAYYRETDPKKLAQLPEIFAEVDTSLCWMERYTGIPYPFEKYDFIIVPGFQYGGMEHVGATLYNDNTIFESEHPTPDEHEHRIELIAHETAHMWFGDLVTMDWFNDVWTKEVFANYFAMLISEPLFPQINHDLNWLKTYYSAALSEDRTSGTTPIRQELDNLSSAGLIYNSIIYDKAPIMMRKLVELMGPDAFREGLREYLHKYAYSNATWDDLVDILSTKTDKPIRAFSNAWVNEKGMPEIRVEKDTTAPGKLRIVQSDPYRRGLLWEQTFKVKVKDTVLTVTLNGTDSVWTCAVPGLEDMKVIPNCDGRGYGYFNLDKEEMKTFLSWSKESDDTQRESMLMILEENYLHGHIPSWPYLRMLADDLHEEKNELIASTMVRYMGEPLRDVTGADRQMVESRLLDESLNHPLPSCRLQLTRFLISNATSSTVVDKLYDVWKHMSNPQLSENDYMKMAYELALRKSDKASEIIETQRMRIKDPDRLRQFDYISPVVTADTQAQDSIFNALLKSENRRVEPWAATVLYYLNCPLREEHSVKYILPGLEALEDVQRTGDIFFPGSWTDALLSGHRSKEAYLQVRKFLDSHPDYPQLLKNKILLSSYALDRANQPVR